MKTFRIEGSIRLLASTEVTAENELEALRNAKHELTLAFNEFVGCDFTTEDITDIEVTEEE